jgi:hypothetical protein
VPRQDFDEAALLQLFAHADERGLDDPQPGETRRHVGIGAVHDDPSVDPHRSIALAVEVLEAVGLGPQRGDVVHQAVHREVFGSSCASPRSRLRAAP